MNIIEKIKKLKGKKSRRFTICKSCECDNKEALKYLDEAKSSVKNANNNMSIHICNLQKIFDGVDYQNSESTTLKSGLRFIITSLKAITYEHCFLLGTLVEIENKITRHGEEK